MPCSHLPARHADHQAETINADLLAFIQSRPARQIVARPVPAPGRSLLSMRTRALDRGAVAERTRRSDSRCAKSRRRRVCGTDLGSTAIRAYPDDLHDDVLRAVSAAIRDPSTACGHEPSCSSLKRSGIGRSCVKTGTGRKRHVSSAHAGRRFARGVLRPFSSSILRQGHKRKSGIVFRESLPGLDVVTMNRGRVSAAADGRITFRAGPIRRWTETSQRSARP
jgi:hypothetical protein